MRTRAIANINSIWGDLDRDLSYRTPDIQLGVNFTIFDVDDNFIIITTLRGSHVRITRASFVAALSHLYDSHSPCRIASNNTMRSVYSFVRSKSYTKSWNSLY